MSNLANVAAVGIGVWIVLTIVGAVAGIAGFVYISRRVR